MSRIDRRTQSIPLTMPAFAPGLASRNNDSSDPPQARSRNDPDYQRTTLKQRFNIDSLLARHRHPTTRLTLLPMPNLLLKLAATSTLLGASLCWLLAMPAHGTNINSTNSNAQSIATVVQKVSDPMLDITEAQVCVMSTHSRFNLVCERSSQLTNQTAIGQPIDQATDPDQSPSEFVFSAEESNAALALFGCDCPTCLNALRSLRLMAVG